MENNEKDFILQHKELYERSKLIDLTFGGPSVYFHNEAIKQQRESKMFLSNRHIEMIYATLTAWGMHRMGEKVLVKLTNFAEFEKSILDNKTIFEELKDKSIVNCKPETYLMYLEKIKEAYKLLRVSINPNATIVANSKALAHILPDLVPPIDQQHTIRFFTQEKEDFYYVNKKGKLTSRKVKMPEVEKQFEEFINYCSRIKYLFDKCDSSIFTLNNIGFNTSFPKIIDNMIMTYVKSV